MSSPYDLAPEPTPPDLPGAVVLRKELDEVVDALTADLLVHALGCVRAFGDFHMALTGGPATSVVYRRLMYDPPMRAFPWKRTHIWLVADRHLDPADPASAYRDVRDWLLDHSDIPPEQMHPVPCDSPEPARAYEAMLQETLAWREKGQDRLDYVLLAPRLNEHPTEPLPGESDRDPLITIEGDVVGMTRRLVNASRFIAVLATGERSREAISLASDESNHPMSLGAVRPIGGELRWYLDFAACGVE
ncbi:MAG: hypothetical protein EA423_08845 [Phycisphaerales bacterium]|nr:MAG: hypothetical protein EA423_08845 [Phycisphaerales bacterium]